MIEAIRALQATIRASRAAPVQPAAPPAAAPMVRSDGGVTVSLSNRAAALVQAKPDEPQAPAQPPRPRFERVV